jgi:xylan 1,4-beta-xylosidase
VRSVLIHPIAFLTLALASTPLTAQVAETITVDAAAPTRPFPHFWEHMLGSGRAVLSLRESYRDDLRSVRSVTALSYVRFHGILDDDIGVYSEGPRGKPLYNFSYVDQVYDGLLANGVRPFVELSFMPSRLAQRNIRHSFWYHPVVSPPRDYRRWDALITALARHLVQRYGIEEVSHWYFEVWNEPNLDFWAGNPKQKTYWTLYDHTARSLKAVDARLRVGGPATAQAAWVTDFIRHCQQSAVPVDFVSSHVYGDDSKKDVFGSSGHISRERMVCSAAAVVAPHLERIQRQFRQPLRRDRRGVHGSVAGGNGAPMRRAGTGHVVLDVFGRIRRTGRGEDAVLWGLWAAGRWRHPQARVQCFRAAAPVG